MKRALVSVTDKTGVVEFCKGLEKLGFEIVSTGGTLNKLTAGGVKAIAIDEVTKFPEMLDGRVKTLHPMVHGGLLYRRDLESHVKTIEELSSFLKTTPQAKNMSLIISSQAVRLILFLQAVFLTTPVKTHKGDL